MRACFRDAGHILGAAITELWVRDAGRTVKLVPTQYPMCSHAWELEIEDDGRWFEVLAWGVFTDRIVEHMGGDPARQIAIGVGYGLERLAMLRYRIDDIRKIDVAHVA